VLNSNVNFIAKKDYINNNNVNANNNNNDALKVKSLLISHKRKTFATRFIQLKFLLKTHIEVFNKFITIKKDKCQYIQ
jgi:hypothetical protein